MPDLTQEVNSRQDGNRSIRRGRCVEVVTDGTRRPRRSKHVGMFLASATVMSRRTRSGERMGTLCHALLKLFRESARYRNSLYSRL